MEFKDLKEDKYSNLLYTIAGSIIGSLIVYLVFIRPTGGQQVVSEHSINSMSPINSIHNDQYNNQYSNQYEDLYLGLSSISNRLRMLESRINMVQNNPIASLAPVQQPIPTMGSYKNNEKWVITRDKTGHIDSLEIVRDAKFNK